MLTDEVWAATLSRSALEGSSASELCESVMADYISRTDEEKPPAYTWPPDVTTRQRAVHISNRVWAGMLARKVIERRSVSEILEQLLRSYLELDRGIPAETPAAQASK